MTTDPETRPDRDGADGRIEEPVDAIDPDAGARGAAYALLASAFAHPDERFHEALRAGDVAAQFEALLDRTPLDVDAPLPATDDDYETLCARYNDLFVVGHAEYEDRTDGSLNATGPPVALYESGYRPDVSWNDVNLDLARAYDYYDLTVDTDEREHHDHLRLELEFAGYLARRAAVADGGEVSEANRSSSERSSDGGADAARLDFLDRHLRHVAEGVAETVDEEPGTGAYGEFAALLDAFTAADRAELVDRLEGG
ncbi:molecular chaperone TorD family protein [Halomicrobium salinisoli]|uniref:molecular chaperone TorD family protein n=1 Tax=Halomicrobium salinisoli TaxID=2878391 RepID=UPI001CF04095|nr:molecular chaperone TorD family protein [Halomicrobium salinisoli]